nr:unnamed protein product [Callosobruchus analis]
MYVLMVESIESMFEEYTGYCKRPSRSVNRGITTKAHIGLRQQTKGPAKYRPGILGLFGKQTTRYQGESKFTNPVDG